MNNTELKLAKNNNRKYCILVGNGTTAIYLSLFSQDYENKRIAIPNNVCMNVVLPIYFSNNIPVFIDIEKKTLGLDIELLKKEKVDAVVGVHAYGNTCDIQELESYSKDNNIFLIEDIAVSQGINYNSKPLGSFGDISILSFGSGKVIDIEHGGAILTDDKKIYEQVIKSLTLLKNFEYDDENKIDEISKKHTKLYNEDYGKSINKYYKQFKNLCLENKYHFLYKFDNKYSENLDNKLDIIDILINTRRSNAMYLEAIFKNSGLDCIKVLKPKYNSSFWRFNIFIEDYRDELFLCLLNKKYKVSSWYHSIDLLFEKRDISNTPISDWVGENIINIWVNEDIDKEYLDNISNDIIYFLKGKKCQ
jgi:dTDP-4-amino-4,6-dideoxygalactose transaminase